MLYLWKTTWIILLTDYKLFKNITQSKTMLGLIWRFIVLLSAFWLLGLALHIAREFIHLMLFLAIVVTIYQLFRAPDM